MAFRKSTSPTLPEPPDRRSSRRRNRRQPGIALRDHPVGAGEPTRGGNPEAIADPDTKCGLCGHWVPAWIPPEPYPRETAGETGLPLEGEAREQGGTRQSSRVH